MSDPATSPGVLNLESDGEDQVDVGADPDDMVDEVDGEDSEEEEKAEGQEGLDLDMAEEDGMGYPDEQDGEHEPGVSNGNAGKRKDGRKSKESGITKEQEAQKKDVVAISEDLLSRPPHGSEIFIGGISRDTAEDDLKELCAPCGEIYEVRLLKDRESGENKGYAFVTFTNKDCAEKAIETLNESELKGKKLRFSHSQSKHRIFIGNVPKNWDKEDLEKSLADKGPGIESIELLKDPQNPSRNRGFAFAEYYNHACAENARKNMSKSSFKLGTNTPTISWADPRGSDSASMAQVKAVYVRNLPDTATEEQLRKLFEHHGEIEKVVLPASKPGQPKRDFGFVHFVDRSSALKAIEKAEEYELEGRVLETSLAKPPAEKKPLEPSYSSQRAGLLPHYQARLGYGYAASDIYGGSARNYSQPLIYGRGPAPAGMTMVPMMLPDGRIGYVLQEPGMQGGSAPYRSGRSSHGSESRGGNGSGSSRRYRPY